LALLYPKTGNKRQKWITKLDDFKGTLETCFIGKVSILKQLFLILKNGLSDSSTGHQPLQAPNH
jgi:hypothetical protein